MEWGTTPGPRYRGLRVCGRWNAHQLLDYVGSKLERVHIGQGARNLGRWSLSVSVLVCLLFASTLAMAQGGDQQQPKSVAPLVDAAQPSSAKSKSAQPESGGLTDSTSGPATAWKPDGARTVGERYGRTPTAADGTPDSAGSATTPGISLGEYFKVLGWLIAVVILAVGTIYGLKKLQSGTAKLTGATRAMEVVARTGLTSKHQLVMVRVAERILIVGVSPDGVHRVSEFTDPKDVVQMSRGESFQEQLEAQQVDMASAEAEEEAKTVDVAPYRREIRQLKDLIGSWKRGASTGVRR